MAFRRMEPRADPAERFSTYLVTFVPSDFMPADEWNAFTSSAFKKVVLERATTPRIRMARRNKNLPGHDRTAIYADSMEDALEARDILYGVLIERGRRDAVEADIARPMVFGSTKKAKKPKPTVSAAWTSFSNAPPSSTGGASVELAPGEGESKLPRGLLNRKKSRKGERHGRRTRQTRRRRSF
jgi:hypothetical protein